MFFTDNDARRFAKILSEDLSFESTLGDEEVDRIANEISAKQRADLSHTLDGIRLRLDDIENGITLLLQKVTQMSDANTNPTPTLDQAVADLAAASTAKIAADQVLAADAQQGLNAAADIAKVEGIVANLNTETAAEQAITNPAPVPVAPVAVPVAATTSVVTDAGQINPIPGVTVVNR